MLVIGKESLFRTNIQIPCKERLRKPLSPISELNVNLVKDFLYANRKWDEM